jgi:peptidoglycan hydrolase-like protein with peptidoglycan-binding domain
VWLQQHLASADPTVVVDGQFGSTTDAALRRFQESRGITPTGVTDEATWRQVLGLPIVTPDWSASGGGARAAGANGPASAVLPPRENEISPPAQRR